MSVEWLLVAHNGGARLFRKAGKAGSWELREQLAHEEHHAHADDLVSDRAGRASKGQAGQRVTMEAEHSPREVEEERFVRRLADLLDQGARSHAFDGLVVAAPPRMLGKLRGTFTREVERRVTATLDRDFAHQPDREVLDVVQAHLATL